MRLCIPTGTDTGKTAHVFGHFGSAPFFTVYDDQTNAYTVSGNRDQKHVHGTCRPTEMIANLKVDAAICGGIGARALERLNASGTKVYKGNSAQTVAEAVAAFKQGLLPEMTLDHTCAGHSHEPGHTCSH